MKDRLSLKSSIVRIGNSQGVRIPRALLEQTGLQGEVRLEAARDAIIIRRETNPREGWDEAFKQMHARGHDQLLDRETATAWDETGWEWK